jgi:outer membrane protein OmpA-like peptidoglycan-associated protein
MTRPCREQRVTSMRFSLQRVRRPLARRAIGYCALACGTGLALLGCGAAAAPQELHNARHAYTQASQGPAAQLAPAQLDTARQGLERANMAFGSGADEAVVRDLAYVAEREVAIAVSAAGLEQANRNLAKYEKEQDDLRRKLQSATQAQLAQMKKELEEQKLAVVTEREARLAAERSAAAALKSLDEVARVKEESRGIVITLSGAVLFATGEHSLLPIAKEKLREVAQALIEQGDTTILVEGHTDSRGSSDKNHELSLLRAQEVRGYLVSQGIPTSNIQAAGLGEERPIASNDTAEGRANNRRVEIVINPKTEKPKT